MGVDSEDEDLVVYGTPIEREEDTSARKRRAVAEAGQLRALPAWKQEVRDEEGRRRFHGAFTGGFSAGFYNTVGSKEGWTPQTFTSSRKNRAELTKQSIYNFLDEEDIKDMGGNALETSQQYDTFGFTAAEYARKQASKEQKERPSAIPGPIPDELVVPTTNSIGVTLLMKMGWRQGRSIRDSHADSLYESRRNARKAFLALSGAKDDEDQDQSAENPSLDRAVVGSVEEIPISGNTPVYVLHPKQDYHGLGYDPFKHAPEFRDRKTLQKSRERDHKRNDVSVRGNLLISNSGHYAPGFGIGALEELDVEDEDIYASGFAYEQTEVDIEPSKAASDSNYKLDDRKRGFYLSFKIASNSEYKLERKWGFEKLVFRNSIGGVRRDRKYAIQARNAYSTGVHMSQNVMGRTTHKTESLIRYYHYHNSINVMGEPCREFVPKPTNGSKLMFEGIPYVYDDNMKRIAGEIKRFEEKTLGSIRT